MTLEPDTVETDTSVDELLERLQVAAALRKGANRHTRAGMDAYEASYTEIRVVAPEAARLGVKRADVAQAAGVSRAQLHSILTHRTAL